jgi:uncharacterized protein (TIGR03435 family)
VRAVPLIGILRGFFSPGQNFVFRMEFNKPIVNHFSMPQKHSAHMRILILFLLAVCLLNAKATSLPDGPDVGQVAPTLKLPQWLQAPPEAALGWPTGKVVVLEFWSTSCGPCVAYIPHLNDLADKFKDKPVQFIAVTDDKESVVKRFLKKTPINAWLGLGAQAGFAEENPYRVFGIPHTVIIDAHGQIAAITDPERLNAAMIQSCLDGLLGTPAGEKISATNKAFMVEERWTPDNGQIPGMVPGQYKAGIRPLFQVMIQPAPTNSTDLRLPSGNDRINEMAERGPETWMPAQAMTLKHVSLSRAIEMAYDVKPARIVAETKLPREKYDFYITVPPVNEHPKKQEVFEAVFAQAVEATFGLTVKRETRDIDVLVLKTNAKSREALSKSTNPDGKYLAGWNEAAATNKPLSVLREELEVASAMPVFDETHLSNHYDFDIKWKQKDYAHPNVPGMIDAVKGLGVDLVPMKKSLEVIIVRKAQ